MREGAARTARGQKLTGHFIAEEAAKPTAAESQNANN